MYWVRVRSRALRDLIVCGSLTFSITTGAHAEPASEPLVVSGFGTCPDPEAVRSAILQLVSPSATAGPGRAALPAQSRVSVNDQGASFRVSVTTEGSDAERTYSDPSRTCERRARFAAVFAVVTLMPPDLGPEAAPPEPKPKPETPPAPAPVVSPAPPEAFRPPPPAPAATPAWLRLELAAVAEQALNNKAELAVRGLGAELEAVFGRDSLAPWLAVAYAPSRELAFADTSCTFTRAQLAAGVRFGESAGPFALSAELGVVAALARIRGSDLAHPATDTSVDFGVRARLAGALAAPRLGPLLAFEASAFPWPSEVWALPRGSLGTLPVLWLGVSIGAYLGL